MVNGEKLFHKAGCHVDTVWARSKTFIVDDVQDVKYHKEFVKSLFVCPYLKVMQIFARYNLSPNSCPKVICF